MARTKKSQKPRTAREQALVVSAYGAHLLLDQRAHRPRIEKDRRREQNRKSCRGRYHEE